MSVGGFTPYRQLGSFSRRKHVWTYSVLVENKFGLFSVLGDRIYEMGCPFLAVGLNVRFIVLPHWDNMSQAQMLTHPVTLYTGPTSYVSWAPLNHKYHTSRDHSIFEVFGMTGPSTNRESNPQNLFGSRAPLSSPFTISRGY